MYNKKIHIIKLQNDTADLSILHPTYTINNNILHVKRNNLSMKIELDKYTRIRYTSFMEVFENDNQKITIFYS